MANTQRPYSDSAKRAEAIRCLEELGQPVSEDLIAEMIDYGEDFDKLYEELAGPRYMAN